MKIVFNPFTGKFDYINDALSVSDEGADQGEATTLNFVGAGVTSSVASGVATVTIAGGSGTQTKAFAFFMG